MSVDVFAFDMRAPDDLELLTNVLDLKDQPDIRRLAILLRVSGEYTDGSRERARAAVEALLARCDLADKAEFITVIGTEGASTACGYALIDRSGPASLSSERRLALGLARVSPPAEATFGSVSFAHSVTEAVTRAMADGGMAAADVETIIVNVPHPSSGDVAKRGRRARAAAALGAGLAIGEIEPDALTEARIVDDPNLFAARVQTYVGPAIRNLEIIALGNVAGAGGHLVACNTVTQDLLDGRSIKRMLVTAGLPLDADGEVETERLVATIAKLGVHADGTVSGAPTNIFTSATPPEKHVRAALSGVLGVTLHTTRIFSTFDPIQQAPPGGGTICCILKA